MLNIENVIQLENDGDRHDNSKLIDRVKKINLLAINYFHSINVSNQRNIPSNHWHGMDKENISWDNCGGGHCTPDFMHPRDKANTKKAKEERAAHWGGGGRGGGRGGGLQCGRKNRSNDNKDWDRNDYGNGVQKRGND